MDLERFEMGGESGLWGHQEGGHQQEVLGGPQEKALGVFRREAVGREAVSRRC